MVGLCKFCSKWDNTPGISECGCGQCVDDSASFDDRGKIPANGWRGTDALVGIETGPEFGCVRFIKKNMELTVHNGDDQEVSKCHEKRFESFISDLRALCLRHRIQLSVSDYDGLQVWPLEDGDEPIRSAGIDNRLPE